ncbi:MAG: Bcr/CflA family efflux MFS transporter [Burkholderiales bacterium]|nr:Bcr/CflA family efflux MFS transporter [Burkholderiales bacterium]
MSRPLSPRLPLSTPALAADNPPVAVSLPLGRAAFALALLLGLQPIATDVYLPALPQLTKALAAPMALSQLTMSALILAFGIAQLAWGPVADRFGRRPVLLAGLALFALCGFGSALAPRVEVLIGWRALQGVALASAVVCARAMVRDLYEPVNGARVMSLAMSGLAVIAIGGPTLGGAVAAAFGWRGTLVLVGLAGLAALAYVGWQLPETVRRRNPAATHAGPLARNWSAMLRHPVFRAWTLLIACTYGGLFTILAASPFVYIEVLGLSSAAYGLTLAWGGGVYLISTFVGRRWIHRHGMAGAVTRGAAFTLAGGALALVATRVESGALWWLLAAHGLYSFGHGMHQPCGQAGAVGPFPQAAGAASALAGFVLAIVAFAIGLALGAALDGTVRPLAYGIAFWAAATAAVAWTLVRRHVAQ